MSAFRTQHGIVVGATSEAAAAMRARGMSEAQIRRNLGFRTARGLADGPRAGAREQDTSNPVACRHEKEGPAVLEAETAPAKQRAVKRRPEAQDILAACAEAAGLTVEELLSKSRARAVVWPRQLAAYLIRRADPEIHLIAMGEMLRQDHTTALYAIRMAETRLELGHKDFTALHKRVRSILKGVLRQARPSTSSGEGELHG